MLIFFSRYLPSEFSSSENPIMPKSALARKTFLPSSLRARKPLNEHPVITPLFCSKLKRSAIKTTRLNIVQTLEHHVCAQINAVTTIIVFSQLRQYGYPVLKCVHRYTEGDNVRDYTFFVYFILCGTLSGQREINKLYQSTRNQQISSCT